MERKKASLSLKTTAKNRKCKEVPLDGETPQVASDHEKRILRDACSVSNRSNLHGSGSLLSRRGSYLETLEKSHNQNEIFHCSFETDSSPGPEIDIPCTQPVSHDKILEDVVAFVEVRSNTENRFDGISKQMEMLGAKVVKKFTAEVTHVIFKDGKKTTREKALKKGIHLVSVLWVESCRQNGKCVSEDLFPVVEHGELTTPLMVGRLKRTKSMQPKAFEEDVQNSADRGERRRKRKLQAENLTPSAMIFCAETQDPYSPMVFKPGPTPHMVPDTPCHALDVSPYSTKVHDWDVDSTEKKLIEPIKFSEDESDESPSSDDGIPSSIRKLKKRLLSKSTPTRPPSLTLTEPKTTPAAQPQKTPKDVLLTGSEQGKKRKREDLTKVTHCENIKENASKQTKKAKVGGQVEGHSKDDKKAKVKTAGIEKDERNVQMARSERNDSGTSVNGVEDTDEQTNQSNIPRKKKAQTKKAKKLREENGSSQNGDDINTFVSREENSTVASSSGASKKRFSKTAKLVAHVDQGEDFGDVNAPGKKEGISIKKKAKPELGAVKKGRKLKQEKGDNEKKQVNQEEVVSQGKPAVQDRLVRLENPVRLEKLECRANGSEEEEETLGDHDEGKNKNKNNARERKGNKGETRTDDSETCTEEDEQQHGEKENRAAKKQRIKLVKKVKPKRSIVMTSMHFNEQDIVLSVVRKLGSFFIEDRVSPSTSHVIAGSPRRTLNVMMAVAHGSWLVSPMWVMKSLEVGYWVDEEPYELSDAFPAAQLCRLERVSVGAGYRQELFVECPPIFVSENCCPPSDSLMTLISLCGGKVSSSVRKAGICIGSMTRRTQAVNITEQWLLDCITQHAVLPFTNYALNSPAKRRRETSPSY